MASTSSESVRDMFSGRDQPVLRCAVYTRQSVANAEQDLTSCDVQRERCENYVRAMQYEGWQLLVERFDDLGVSGAETSRPGLDKLKLWCVQGRVDVLVVARLDRLNRKMSHWVELADWFKQVGVEIVRLEGGSAARGPLADLVNNVVASFAEFERDLLRERLLDAHARLRERGLRSAGRVPLGYKADLATRQLVIDEDEAAVVRAFFERCAAGESAASIARWANDAGHRTKVHGRQGGNGWSGRTVLQILRNPIYVGEPVHAGGTVEGVHEGIIDADLAQRAWLGIDERRTRRPEPRGPALDWDRDPYMLRGPLRCAGCGRVMTTSASAKATIYNADEVPRYYRCRGDAERPACTPSVQVSAQKVEAIVLGVLRAVSASRACLRVGRRRDTRPRALARPRCVFEGFRRPRQRRHRARPYPSSEPCAAVCARRCREPPSRPANLRPRKSLVVVRLWAGEPSALWCEPAIRRLEASLRPQSI